ncbi:MAG TPA: lamin tail domain-containing protein, partial [Methylomirabilota bacterium]|nr:lamin tail domain-containing protein [Methylomirabilota bacterium]
SNALPSQGTVRLRSDINAILLEVEYSDENPWPVGADGTGHSLVLARASYGQNVPRSWDTSDRVGGSPGKHEPLRMKTGQRAVVINEILAHTDLPQLDYIELYNYSMQPVDISGCYLTDSRATNKFRIPAGTILAPHGYIAFTEADLGFALNHEGGRGETIYFRSADATRMLDTLQYEPQENGVAFGRYPDGSPEFYRLTALTPGTTNAPYLVNDIVINEIMYGPISEEDDDEYVELHNKGTNAVDIGGWRFTRGIDLTFPPNTIIQPNGYVVAAKNSAHLISHHANLSSANTFGNFDGTLSRDGERLALAKPDYDFITNGNLITTNVSYIVVAEVTYGTGGRWGQWANQGGSSLELIDPRANPRLAYNWGDSDETEKSQWTYFEQTGLLDTGNTQGASPINRLEVIMLGEGECLLDDVEVRSPVSAGNLVPNFGFEAGLSPWVPQGNHLYSGLESSFSGHTGIRSLHVRSDGNGDTGANRVRVALNAAVVAGQMATVKGYVRWLRGWPEITLRIKGGFLEAYGRMHLPTNLGTPGARNSRALTNNAPALHGVVHSPALPQLNEPAVVTAGVQDPDGVANVTLFYRVDVASPLAFAPFPMNDNGTNGDAIARDGFYSATIPAQAAGTMISFYVEATDTRAATSQFPVNAIVAAPDGQRRECLVRWADPIPVSAFSTYRMWLSRANVSAYVNRPALSNQDIDGTMIVNNNRVIYNISSHYSNSPYHQTQNGSPETGGQHFTIHLPLDDKYLGTENFNKVHAPGNASFEDNNWLREQTAYWVARKAGMPYLYRRFVAMYVNGTRKAGGNAGPDALMEDTQRPGGELIDEFFPDETDGRLFKLQPWFEFDDVTVVNGSTQAGFDNEMWCTLTPNLSTNAHKITRYRQNYLTRSADKTANDYTNVIALINAAAMPTTSPSYWQNLDALIDVEQWAHIFAVEHAVGNWDSFGGVNAQNMYGYKPDHGKWKLMIWDFNIVLNNASGNPGGAGPGTTSNPPGGNLFDVQSGQDPNMAAMEAYPPFRRAWWRAYKKLTVGPDAPMLAANCDPLIDAKYAAFRASGLNPPGAAASVKGFLSTARTTIAAAVAAVDLGNFAVTTPTINASSNLVTISGVAPLDVTDIKLNGISGVITWNTISNWSIRLPVTNTTQLSVVAFDKNANMIGNTNAVTVNYAAPAIPDPRGFIIFNEIMYNPSSPDAEYIELYNMHATWAFNIAGWRINGVDYTFPEGSYFPPRSFIIVTKDRVRFNVAYGASIPVLGEYSGNLQSNGETLTLIKPAASSNEVEVVVDKVRYDSALPWPGAADGTGS